MKQSLGSVYVLTAGSLWGLMGVFVRHFSALGLAPLDIALFRVLFGLIIVGAYLAVFHRELLKIRLRDLWCFAGTGIGSFFLLNLTYYTAMEYTSLAVAGVLLYTAPIFVMLLSAMLFRETITKRKLIALFLAFFGCVLVSGLGTDSQISPQGLFWGLGAGITYALYSIFGRFAIRRGYGSWTITFWSFVFALLASLLFCDRQATALVWQQPADLGWAVVMGIVTAFLPYVFYGLGLERMEGSRASILASVEPVVATVCSVALFREALSIGALFGIMLVLSAIILLSLPKKRQIVV